MLSIWKKDPSDVPVWHGFNTRNLHYLDGLEAYLDSAGFVAASRYQGFAWTVDDYLDLGRLAPLALVRLYGPLRRTRNRPKPRSGSGPDLQYRRPQPGLYSRCHGARHPQPLDACIAGLVAGGLCPLP